MSDDTKPRKKPRPRSSRNAQVRQLTKKHDKRSTVRVAGSTIDLLRDPDQIKDWDDEELERGRRRDKNGNFQGSAPTIIPMECFRELNRRRMLKAQQMMSEGVAPALRELKKILDSETAEDKDKIAAAKLLLDRGLGKEPQTIDVNVETPKWLQALQGGIVATTNEPDDDIEDAEVIWDSDDDQEVS